MKQNILIIEDDENLRFVLLDNLTEQGYEVDGAATAAEAAQKIHTRKFDLIILDIMLPDTDGYTLCRNLRQDGCESMILMLTARSLEDDIVQGFEAGADDYLVKPYKLRELLLRIRALLRRQQPLSTQEQKLADIRIDTEARRVYDVDNNEINLTKKEFDLLECLISNRNRALTREQILNQVWGQNVVVEERTVDNFISNLKKKLRWTAQSNYRIVSLRGIGYRMEIDENS